MPSRSAAWVRREKLLQQPSTFAERFPDNTEVNPSELTSLLIVQAVKGDQEGALDSLRRMQKMFPDEVDYRHYNHVLTTMARRGEVDKFDALWQEAEKSGLGRGDLYTFASATKCYMRSGDPERALGVIEQAKRAGVEPNEVVYGALLSGFAQRGDYNGAAGVWDYLRTTKGAPPIDSVLYTAMIHACAKVGKAERALQLLDDMKAEGVVPTDVTYNAALYAVARRKDKWQDAKELFTAMLTAGVEPTEYTMNTMLLCASRAGDVESCRKIVADMERMEGMEVTQLTLCTQIHGIAYGLWQCSLPERKPLVTEAEEIFAEVESKWGANDRARLARLHVFASGHMLQRAQQCFADLGEKPGSGAHTLMLKMWAETGRPKELEIAWERLKAEIAKPDQRSYRFVIEGFARAYWVKTAVSVLREMVEKHKMVPSKKHVQLLIHRCAEKDLRKERLEVYDLLSKSKEGSEVRTQVERNEAALLQQKLSGEGVRTFLLPFPLVQLKNKHT